MNILIYNPSPSAPEEHPYWGDYHYGISLQQALQALGHDVAMRCFEDWHPDLSTDLLVVLRGLRPTPELLPQARHRAIWIISNPQRISERELNAYDTVFTASEAHCKALLKAGHPAQLLLQAVDVQRFYREDREARALAHDFVFVGNARDEQRWLIAQALEAHLPLRIWGRGWNALAELPAVVAESWPNELLGNLYRDSYAVLCDHAPEMSALGFVNNRIYDALACATPVLSENHAGFAPLAFEGICFIDPKSPAPTQFDNFMQRS